MLSGLRARRARAPGPPDDPGADPGTAGEPQGLLANTGWLLASRVVQAVLGWGGTVLIARTLSLEEFGRFTLIFTLLGVMSVVTDMGTGRIAVRGMVGRDPSAFAGAYLVLRTLLGLVGYVLVLAVVVVLRYPAEVVAATAVAGLVVIVATPSAALDVVFQARLRMGVVSAAGVAGLVAQLALTAALAAAGGSLLLFTIPAVFCQVVDLSWKVRAAHRLVPIRPRVDRALWGSLLREAIPLTVGFGLATLYYRVGAIMLSRLDGFEAVGVYGVSNKFVDIVHFAATAVTVPLLTVLVRSWPDDLPALRDAVRRGAMLLGILGGLALVGLLGFAGPVTTLLYGEPYAVGQDATRILVAAQVLTLFATLGLTCLVAVGRHGQYPVVMLIGLVLNVGANVVAIPRWSYEGAAVATLGSEVVVLAMLWVLLRRVPGLWPLDLTRLLAVPVAVAAGVLAGWAVDLVVAWVWGALAGVVVFLGVVTAGGVSAAAGIVLPARTSARRVAS